MEDQKNTLSIEHRKLLADFKTGEAWAAFLRLITICDASADIHLRTAKEYGDLRFYQGVLAGIVMVKQMIETLSKPTNVPEGPPSPSNFRKQGRLLKFPPQAEVTGCEAQSQVVSVPPDNQ